MPQTQPHIARRARVLFLKAHLADELPPAPAAYSMVHPSMLDQSQGGTGALGLAGDGGNSLCMFTNPATHLKLNSWKSAPCACRAVLITSADISGVLSFLKGRAEFPFWGLLLHNPFPPVSAMGFCFLP